MSISGVNGIGATAYAYMNSSMKTTGEGNFASEAVQICVVLYRPAFSRSLCSARLWFCFACGRTNGYIFSVYSPWYGKYHKAHYLP